MFENVPEKSMNTFEHLDNYYAGRTGTLPQRQLIVTYEYVGNTDNIEYTAVEQPNGLVLDEQCCWTQGVGELMKQFREGFPNHNIRFDMQMTSEQKAELEVRLTIARNALGY